MSVLAAPRSLNRLTRSELLARVLAPLHTDEERWWDQRVHLPILSGASPSPPANGASAITAVRHSTHAPDRDADDDSSSNIVVKLVQCDALHGVLNLSALRALACTSRGLHATVHDCLCQLRSLQIGEEEATIANANFVACYLPALETLRVSPRDERSATATLDLRRFRRCCIAASGGALALPSGLSAAAGLFCGAVLAESVVGSVVLSDSRVLELDRLRTCACLQLRGEHGRRGLAPGDLACLLPTLQRNRALQELDLCGNPTLCLTTPAPTSAVSGTMDETAAAPGMLLAALQHACIFAAVRHHVQLAMRDRDCRPAVVLPPAWQSARSASASMRWMRYVHDADEDDRAASVDGGGVYRVPLPPCPEPA